MSTENVNILQVEKLYYTLRYDLVAGKQLFFDLAEKRSEFLDKLLPGEMSRLIQRYKPDEQIEIFKQLAEIEKRLGHLQQAKNYWEQVLKLTEKYKNSPDIILAQVGLFNVTWQNSPKKALDKYLRPALKLSEQETPKSLPLVQYEIGFAERQMYNIKTAIEWYEKARDSAATYGVDLSTLATILNDLGFAYTFMGEYRRAEVNVEKALKLRQRALTDIKDDLINIQNLLETATGKKASLREQADRLHIQESQRAKEIGTTFNTLGEITRYKTDLEKSLYYYSQAWDIFREEDEYFWQARALFSRAEVHRRIALNKNDFGDPLGSQTHRQEAKNDIQESLYLCTKYGFYGGRSTALRRMGRWLHDEALYVKGKDDRKAQTFLEEALEEFKNALVFARRASDTLEEFENLTEIAFIVDDLVEVSSNSVARPEIYEDYINQLAETLEKHQNDDVRVYQFPVFENLLNMEKAAYAYVLGHYDEALELYVAAYSGLASDPGYGSTRYRVHFDHLQTRIEGIEDVKLAKKWCAKFINAWKMTKMQHRQPQQTLAQVHPELIEWCQVHLLTIG